MLISDIKIVHLHVLNSTNKQYPKMCCNLVKYFFINLIALLVHLKQGGINENSCSYISENSINANLHSKKEN